MNLTQLLSETATPGSLRRKAEYDKTIKQLVSKSARLENELEVAQTELDHLFVDGSKPAADVLDKARAKVHRIEQSVKLIGGEMNVAAGIKVWGGVDATKRKMLHGVEDN